MITDRLDLSDQLTREMYEKYANGRDIAFHHMDVKKIVEGGINGMRFNLLF